MSVRVLILGAGGWGNQHALEYASIDEASVVAAVDNRPDVLAAFLTRHGIERGFASLEEALSWGDFDAASNVTPDAVHHPTTLALLAAGKHVLCEKPLATNVAHAMQMAGAAAAAGVVNLVNLRYRGVPALEAAHRLVAEGAIGAVRHFEASYLQSWLMQPAWGDWKSDPTWLWRVSTSHGSNGVLGDVGIHILDFATYAAGAHPVDVSWRLKTFDKAPGNRIGEYVLDANDGFVMHAERRGRRDRHRHGDALRGRAPQRPAAAPLRRPGRTRGALREPRERATRQPRRGPRDGNLANAADTARAVHLERFVTAIVDGTKTDPDFAHGAMLQGLLDEALAIRS